VHETVLLLAVAAASVSVPAAGQPTYEVVRMFLDPGGEIAPKLALGPDGTFYGTMRTGGSFRVGSVFALHPNGSDFSFEEIYSFTGAEGFYPDQGVTLGTDGALYGPTVEGGAHGRGAFFRLDRRGRATRIHSIEADEGLGPSALTLGPDGFFYGTNRFGGTAGAGELFRLSPSGEYTTLYTFAGTPEGAFPNSLLSLGADGRLYGTTLQGGTGSGTVFAATTSGDVTTLHRLTTAEGAQPVNGVAFGADGRLYGTTQKGGAHDSGTAYRLTTGGQFELLHDFPLPKPMSNLVLAVDGYVYGTTVEPGFPDPGLTSLFRIAQGGTFETVTDQSSVVSGTIVLGADQMLYSTTPGSVIRMSLAGTDWSQVYVHTPASQPVGPMGRLTEQQDGTLAGISESYPPIARLLYELDGDGEATILHAFEKFPFDVLLASDGHYYGGTVDVNSDALVFRVEADDSETTLHTFLAAGRPPNPLVEFNGAYWGTMSSDGANGLGYLFKVDALGTYTPLHDFDFPEGGQPSDALTLAADGNLYGTALVSTNFGTVFRAKPDGTVEAVHDFVEADGEQPVGRLEAASDGFLYGTTGSAGASGHGTAFRTDLAGNLTKLYDFPTLHDPSLTEGEAGAFYGTISPGMAEPGQVFRMDSGGAVTVAHDFFHDFTAFLSPYGPILRAADGALYGTAQRGGLYDQGGVYRILPNPEAAVLLSVTPSSGSAAGGAAIVIRGRHLTGPFSLGDTPLAARADRQSLWFATTPPLSPGTVLDLNTESFDGATVSLPAAFFADFVDVPNDHLFHDYIETLVRNGITAGCGAGAYCPVSPVRRDQMAVFLLKAEHGSGYTPPACTGVFGDVVCPSAFADWVEQLAAEGITGGCGSGNYCPTSPVRRDQMAAFLLKAEHGSSYVPPPCTGIFGDVACPSQFADWIEQLSTEQITGGCGGGNYCPQNANTRGQMAVFLVKTFHLQ
jgi:uncharacterized repeat protein (TIGR03803 family)